jgi:hypothetical protein
MARASILARTITVTGSGDNGADQGERQGETN